MAKFELEEIAAPEDSKSHQKALSTEIEGLDFATAEEVEEAGWGTAR